MATHRLQGQTAPFACLLAFTLASALVAADSAAFRTDKLVVATHPLNAHVRELDGQWQGNIFASDGNVYFFSSTHAAQHGAAFFRYNPPTNQLTLLCEDITLVCGEDPKKTTPQGKVHSDIIELDGWLYFVTHLSRYTEREAAAYPGAHLVGYQINTGKFRDYGVIHPHYSCYSGLAVDAQRKVAYVYLRPFFHRARPEDSARIYRIHLESGHKENLGRLHEGNGSCYHIFLDADGNCWFTSRDMFFRIRPDRLTAERVDGVLPEPRSWRWAQALPDGRRCLVTFADSPNLWLFDAREPVRRESFRLIANIGPTELGMVCDGERVFYIQREGRKDWLPGGGSDGDLHLLSLALAANPHPQITDHGLLLDTEGRRPWKLASLSTDGQGRIFLVGAWRLLPGEEKQLGVWKGTSGRWCGQFLGIADLATRPGTDRP